MYGAGAVAADQPAAAEMMHAGSAAHDGGADIVPVKPGLDMVIVHGENVAVQFGYDGVVAVDSGAPGDSAALLAAIKQISPEPIRYIINTSAARDRTGGNAQLAMAGHGYVQGETGFGGGRFVNTSLAQIMARETVLNTLTAATGAGYSQDALPSVTYSEGQQNLVLSGQTMEIVPVNPPAHSNGDSFVIFRQADVIAAGDVVDMLRFPQIDVANGGTINGEVAALNRLVDIVAPALPLYWQGGGTVVIPGRGRLAQALEIVQYRDMVTIVRDRVQALIDQHRSLAQVRAANPTAGYNNRYGAEKGPWTTDQFVTAVYQTLTASHAHKGSGK
jgi:glyoxylase-like metal-dependent hydrolase (beta-lactamase superfamily II)